MLWLAIHTHTQINNMTDMLMLNGNIDTFSLEHICNSALIYLRTCAYMLLEWFFLFLWTFRLVQKKWYFHFRTFTHINQSHSGSPFIYRLLFYIFLFAWELARPCPAYFSVEMEKAGSKQSSDNSTENKIEKTIKITFVHRQVYVVRVYVCVCAVHLPKIVCENLFRLIRWSFFIAR